MERESWNQLKLEQNVITVVGEGSIMALPERVDIVLGVRTESPNLQAAQAENAEVSRNIINSMLNLGISREQIQTSEYRIEPVYTYEDGKQIFQGYRVIHLLTISIFNPGMAGSVVDTAVKQGANEVVSIQFNLSNKQHYYQQALSGAVLNSQQKAEAIAASLGVRLNRIPFSVNEELSPGGPIPLTSVLEKGYGGTPIQPGQLEIKAVVTAKYRFG